MVKIILSYKNIRKYKYNKSFEELDDVESEMQRLKVELKQTMQMYNAAC